jgi:hypothetical protein
MLVSDSVSVGDPRVAARVGDSPEAYACVARGPRSAFRATPTNTLPPTPTRAAGREPAC